jgi:hypothetical protein
MEASKPYQASKALIRRSHVTTLFWHAQCSFVPTESRSFYEVALFLRLHARGRFVSGLVSDRSSTMIGVA